MDKKKVFSWALYDLANTIFSMNVISLYFPILINKVYGKEDIYYSVPLSISMVLLLLALPVLGKKADMSRHKMRYLFNFTILCIIATALMAFEFHLFVILLLLIIANFSFHAGLLFYNALLLYISTEKNRGFISGIGVSLGYFGSILGMISVLFIVKKYGVQMQFIPTAILFFIFAVPIFVFVKDPKNEEIIETDESVEWKQIFLSIKKLKNFPALKWFFISRLFFAEVINTIIPFMSIYTVNVLGFKEGKDVELMLISATVCAMVGAFIIGKAADRFTHYKTLRKVLVLWIIVLIATVITPSKIMFYGVAALAGIALGGVWTTDRPLLIKYAPPENIGEFFALYEVTGKAGAIVGPLIWGGTIWVFRSFPVLKYRIAVFTLLIFMIIGYYLLGKIKKFETD